MGYILLTFKNKIGSHKYVAVEPCNNTKEGITTVLFKFPTNQIKFGSKLLKIFHRPREGAESLCLELNQLCFLFMHKQVSSTIIWDEGTL